MAKAENKNVQQENVTPAATPEDPDNTQESDPEEDTDSDEAEGEEEEEKVLIAQAFILYDSRQYKPGDELPANNEGMVEAWIDAGTAAWVNVSNPSVSAKSATAQVGLSGESVGSESEDGENLVGRVPRTAGRRRT